MYVHAEITLIQNRAEAKIMSFFSLSGPCDFQEEALCKFAQTDKYRWKCLNHHEYTFQGRLNAGPLMESCQVSVLA